MLTRLKQFAALPAPDQGTFILAWLLLGWMRVAIFTVSFRKLAASLALHQEVVAAAPLSPAQCQRAVRIGWLVASAARCTPWQSRCLIQVLVVQRLLARCAIPGQFYLGVVRENAGGAPRAGLSAHAWVQCGNVIVNGGAGHERFRVLSTYRWLSSDPA